MNFTQIGYQSALVDLGIVKESAATAAAAAPVKGLLSRAGTAIKGLFTRTPAPEKFEVLGATRAGDRAMDRAGAGLKPRKARATPMAQGYESIERDIIKKSRKPVAPPAPKNPVAPEAPAMTPPQNEAAGGLLAKIRRNPVKSVGIAGAGAGGLGYVMGQGAQKQEQPMQQYGQPPMMY